jgi:hypothetical protein
MNEERPGGRPAAVSRQIGAMRIEFLDAAGANTAPPWIIVTETQ